MAFVRRLLDCRICPGLKSRVNRQALPILATCDTDPVGRGGCVFLVDGGRISPMRGPPFDRPQCKLNAVDQSSRCCETVCISQLFIGGF